MGGALSCLTATQLGAHAITGALSSAGIEGSLIEEAYMGNVVSAGKVDFCIV